MATPLTAAGQGPGDLIVQAPDVADGLLLLFHGVGSSAEDMVALAQVLARQLPCHWVVCVRSPQPCDLGAGWQWFSVRGVDEANRPALNGGACRAPGHRSFPDRADPLPHSRGRQGIR